MNNDIASYYARKHRDPGMMQVSLTIGEAKVQYHLTYDADFVADKATAMFLSKDPAGCEPEVAHLMARVLKPGDTAVDGGANIGYFTVLMAVLVGPAGTVLAFEPGPNNLPKLRENILINRLAHVEVHPMALWHKEEPVTLFLAADSGVNSLGTHSEVLGSTPVPAKPLDAFLRDHDPRLIKLDVEGAEEHVLTGAVAALDRGVPYIVCEINERALAVLGSTQQSLRDFMYGQGYSMFCLHADGGLPTLIPPETVLRISNKNTNVLFSSVLDVQRAWPEVTV